MSRKQSQSQQQTCFSREVKGFQTNSDGIGMTMLWCLQQDMYTVGFQVPPIFLDKSFTKLFSKPVQPLAQIQLFEKGGNSRFAVWFGSQASWEIFWLLDPQLVQDVCIYQFLAQVHQLRFRLDFKHNLRTTRGISEASSSTLTCLISTPTEQSLTVPICRQDQVACSCSSLEDSCT